MEEFKGKIGILGTGRTARAMAAYLMEKNCCPVMWGRNREALRKIREQGIVTLGCIEGHFYPQVQEDLKEVSGLCDYLFVMTTSQGHRDLAKSLKGLLKQDQRILIFNGNWGAYEFFEELEEEIEEKQAVIGETGGMIFIADYDGEACRIKSIKNRMSAAAFPCDYGEVLVQELEPVLPQLKAEANVLVTSINNSNPVIHVPLVMTNFTRIENGEDFLFYGEGATVSSVHYIEEIDREREAAARALGVEFQSCLDIINSFWTEKQDTLYEALHGNQTYLAVKGPRTLKHRYLEEDLPYGIMPLLALAKACHVPAPRLKAMAGCFQCLLGQQTEPAGLSFSRDRLDSLISYRR